MSRNTLMENKSVIIIKKEGASFDDFIQMLNVYRLKYPSHFGYVAWDTTTKKYKKMDSVWWSFDTFVQDIYKNATWNDIVIATMTILTAPNVSNTFFRAGGTNAIRLFNLNGVYNSTIYSYDSSNRADTKILAFTNDIYYKNKRIPPREFLEQITKNGYMQEFKKDPMAWIRNEKNETCLKEGDKLCLFNPQDDDFQLQYMKAFPSSTGMIKLPNDIIVSDGSPAISIVDNADLNIVDNRSNGTNTRSEYPPTPRMALARIEEEWETFSFKQTDIDVLIRKIEAKQYQLDAAKKRYRETGLLPTKTTSNESGIDGVMSHGNHADDDSDCEVTYHDGYPRRHSYSKHSFRGNLHPEIPPTIFDTPRVDAIALDNIYAEYMNEGFPY